MSRMERVKNAIAATAAKLSKEVSASHAKNKIPNDYSLGFCNAMIFADHHVNMRDGDPKFFDRTTSIGALPKPTVLKQNSEIAGADAAYERMRDEVILAARNFALLDGADTEKTFQALVAIKNTVKTMDNFVDQMVDLEEELAAEKVEVASTPDAGAASQDGSNPSSAATPDQEVAS